MGLSSYVLKPQRKSCCKSFVQVSTPFYTRVTSVQGIAGTIHLQSPIATNQKLQHHPRQHRHVLPHQPQRSLRTQYCIHPAPTRFPQRAERLCQSCMGLGARQGFPSFLERPQPNARLAVKETGGEGHRLRVYTEAVAVASSIVRSILGMLCPSSQKMLVLDVGGSTMDIAVCFVQHSKSMPRFTAIQAIRLHYACRLHQLAYEIGEMLSKQARSQVGRRRANVDNN